MKVASDEKRTTLPVGGGRKPAEVGKYGRGFDGPIRNARPLRLKFIRVEGEMSAIKAVINGVEIKVKAGATILEAAHAGGL